MNKKPVILVVDDEHLVLETVVALLENIRGYNVIGAHSFDSAAGHLADRDSVAILISDYRLWKRRSGLELCEIAVALNAGIAIVLMSAESEYDMSVRPQRAVYLQKPFGRYDLLNAIKAAKLKVKEVNRDAGGSESSALAGV